jgi:predicted DNA-binding WGR domain protein
MRTFEYSDAKSNKFWNIELKGKSFTVNFGKMGTAGQTQEKPFPDEAKAKKEYEKLITEKVKKGYKETTPAGAPVAAAPPAPAPVAAAPAPAPAAAAPAPAPAAKSGARRFEYSDDKSNKFWNIELKGKSFTVNFGKMGTGGQTQVKDFPDEAKAKKEYEKLIGEKVKKGYQEMK